MKTIVNLSKSMLLITCFLVSCAFGGPKTKKSHDGKCSGGKNCTACKNCNYCKNCNSGGTCSVCVPEDYKEKARPAKKTAATKKTAPVNKPSGTKKAAAKKKPVVLHSEKIAP